MGLAQARPNNIIGVMSSAQVQVMVLSTVVNSVNSIGGFSVFQRTGFSGLPLMPVVPAGSYMSEGLLPIPEYLTKKILQLELVKMPETWLKDKEENMRNMLSLLWRRTAPVTDILKWLQCFGLLQKYPKWCQN